MPSIIGLTFLKLILMPQSIPDDSTTPEKCCNKIKENSHAERWYINHGKEITCKTRDAAGHVYEIFSILQLILHLFPQKQDFDFLLNNLLKFEEVFL